MLACRTYHTVRVTLSVRVIVVVIVTVTVIVTARGDFFYVNSNWGH